MGNFSRDRRSGGRDFGHRDSGRPTMFKTVCSQCGERCEVPFRPTGSKPVYCSDCFRKEDDFRPSNRSSNRDYGRRDSGRRDFGGRDSGGRDSGGRDFGRSDFGDKDMYAVTCDSCGMECEVPFKPTKGKPVYCNDCFGANKDLGFGAKRPDQSVEQFDKLNAKLDKIIKILEIIKPKKTYTIEQADLNQAVEKQEVSLVVEQSEEKQKEKTKAKTGKLETKGKNSEKETKGDKPAKKETKAKKIKKS